MGAAELTQLPRPRSRAAAFAGDEHGRRIALAYAGLWALTGLGAMIGAAVPGLAPGGRPHPALHGTPSELAAIAAVNARVLSAPFLLVLLGFPDHRRSRRLGDVLVGALLAGNALRLGVALGRWRGRLLPYLPQLPVEWLAAAVAMAAWLILRAGGRRDTALAYLAALLMLVVAAAAIETTCTPHLGPRVTRESTTRPVAAPAGPLARAGGLGWVVLRPGLCAGAGARCKVASLPSPHCCSVPLGRLAGAAGLSSTTPGSRKGGTSRERSAPNRKAHPGRHRARARRHQGRAAAACGAARPR
jgi:hypothetical protein